MNALNLQFVLQDHWERLQALEEMADQVGRLNLRDGSLPRKKRAEKASEVVQEIDPVVGPLRVFFPITLPHTVLFKLNFGDLELKNH